MADNSKIEWLSGDDGSKGATWNPIRAWLKSSMINVPPQRWGYHCERISPGCKHCYASTMNGRMLPARGTGLDYTVPNREKVEVFLDEQELLKPLKWRKQKKIFPCSMTDWCADFVTDEMRDRMMAVAALCPQHTFLFLTKRAERCAEYFAYEWRWENIRRINAGRLQPEWNFPLPNVLLGFSAENQECFDARWNTMRPLAAAGWNVWCSAEPLLGPIDALRALHPNPYIRIPGGYAGDRPEMMAKLSWVVAGGESGHSARPMNVAWVRSIIRQCADSGVACFVKQMGAKPEEEVIAQSDGHKWMRRVALKDRTKGGDMSEWPEDLRVREWPVAP